MKVAAVGALFALSAYAQEVDVVEYLEDGSIPSAIVDVQEDVALEEFFAGVEGDAMMLQVISDMNGLEQYLETRNMTRSAGGLTGPDQDERTLAAEEALGGLKRFSEFKQLVSWLQPVDKRITRYCFYGCWCLPEGAHSFVAGTGRPVDLVDRSCQQLWFCYTCAMAEFKYVFPSGVIKRCDPTSRRYTFKFRYDKYRPKDYSKRDIRCKDDWHLPPYADTRPGKLRLKSTCARAICECDRGAAFRLGRFWRHWDKSRHRIWSISVTDCATNAHCSSENDVGSQEWKDCRALPENSCLFITSKRCVFGEEGGAKVDSEEICCGVYQDEGKRYLQRDHGGHFACCAHSTGDGSYNKHPWDGNMYNVLTHCCPHGAVKSAAAGECG